MRKQTVGPRDTSPPHPTRPNPSRSLGPGIFSPDVEEISVDPVALEQLSLLSNPCRGADLQTDTWPSLTTVLCPPPNHPNSLPFPLQHFLWFVVHFMDGKPHVGRLRVS